METGIYSNMIDKEYFAEPAASASFLKQLTVSPENAWRYAMFPKEQTDAMKFGSQVHCMCLYGPEEFEKQYPVKPEGMNFRTKEGKEWKAENPDFITQEKLDTLLLMQEQMPDFSNSQREVAIFWEDERTGLPCKAKADIVNKVENGHMLFDLKTFTNPMSKPLEKHLTSEIFNRNYHLQAAHYARGWEAVTGEKIETFGFLFIENEERLPAFRVKRMPIYQNGETSGVFDYACDQLDNMLSIYANFYKTFGFDRDKPWKEQNYVTEINEDNTPVYLLPKEYRND